jgi:hypothetical protein
MSHTPITTCPLQSESIFAIEFFLVVPNHADSAETVPLVHVMESHIRASRDRLLAVAVTRLLV